MLYWYKTRNTDAERARLQAVAAEKAAADVKAAADKAAAEKAAAAKAAADAKVVYLVYLLYWKKITNTDAKALGSRLLPKRLLLRRLLPQKLLLMPR